MPRARSWYRESDTARHMTKPPLRNSSRASVKYSEFTKLTTFTKLGICRVIVILVPFVDQESRILGRCARPSVSGSPCAGTATSRPTRPERRSACQDRRDQRAEHQHSRELAEKDPEK